MVNIHVLVILVFIVKIIGSIIAISISKIRNNTAIKKNWIEKGDRADLLGSNPHSKGDSFSRSLFDVFEIIVHTTITIIDNKIAKVAEIVTKYIILSLLLRSFDWKSKIFIYTKRIRFIYLISKLRCKGKVILHLQSVNIMLLLQIRSDDSWKNDI